MNDMALEFMGKLDTAIAQQHKVLDFARQHVEAGQARWRQQHRTLKSYDVLQQRLTAGEARTEARREQRQSSHRQQRL
jgi:flagellar FliJ protein